MLPLIVYIPLWLFLPYTFQKCDNNIEGVYIESEKTVYLCEWTGIFTKNHEIWHYEYYRLTPEQKEQYKKAYERDLKLYNKNPSGRYFYRYYGLTSPEEDFAENYALMVEGKRHPFPLQSRINLIKNFTK